MTAWNGDDPLPMGTDPNILSRLAKERDTERTRADKAEQREGELREKARYHAINLEQCSIFAADAGPSVAKAMTDAAAFLRTLIQPEPDPLVGLIADIEAEIARQRETRGDYLDYGQPDALLVRALEALSIVKGESL